MYTLSIEHGPPGSSPFPHAVMTFPVYLDLFGLRLHPHIVLEGLGYFIGARV